MALTGQGLRAVRFDGISSGFPWGESIEVLILILDLSKTTETTFTGEILYMTNK